MDKTKSATDLPAQSRSGLVRIGDTVRRPLTPASKTIHALLLHLEQVGFAHAPRFLGIDAEGREILSYINGYIGHDPVPPVYWSDLALDRAAQLLRRYHDAVADFVPPSDTKWALDIPPWVKPEIIAHNDFAPYNCVYRNNIPFALIDFDVVAPASRLWDLAYSAYRFVPLCDPQHLRAEHLKHNSSKPKHLDPPLPLDQSDRLLKFCDAYDLEDRTALLETIQSRVKAIRDYTAQAAAIPGPNAERIKGEGHLAAYERDLRFLDRSAANLQAHLLG